jgi:two-component system, sensor histidine kinase
MSDKGTTPEGSHADSPAQPQPLSTPTLVVRGNLQRDLFRLGVVPCAAVALALTGWFTHNRLQTLEAAFDAEGQAVARQVAAMSDLSLYAGDLPALQNVANAALRGGQVMRVEISNSAGVFVTAGPKASALAQLRMFTSPVTLREASRASAFAPAGSTAAGETPIGLVQTFRDTTAYARERSRSLMAGIGIAMVALLAAWASVRHMARTVARPLRRVSRTVAALEAGHFEARCDVVEGEPRSVSAASSGKGHTHELAVLAHDIDRLAERLQRNRQVSEERVREPRRWRCSAWPKPSRRRCRAHGSWPRPATTCGSRCMPWGFSSMACCQAPPRRSARPCCACRRAPSSWACCSTTCSKSRGSTPRC